VVEHIRNLIVSRIAKEPGRIVELSEADLQALGQQASETDTERLVMLFDSLSRTLEEMRWSPHQRFTFEVGLVKACSVAPLRPLGEVVEQLRTLETKLGASRQNNSASTEAVRERSSGYAGPSPHQAPAVARPATTARQGDPWGKVLEALKQRKPNLGSSFVNSKVVESTNDALVIGMKGSSFQVELADKKENRELIEQLVAEVFGRRVQITFRLLAADRETETRQAAPKKPTPADQDPLVQDALNIFQGKIIEPESS
jgi:DNA polymerase III gamma/tau subunit